MKFQKKFAGRYEYNFGCNRGYTPPEETHKQPDEPDALDAGGVVEGFGVSGLASGCWV